MDEFQRFNELAYEIGMSASYKAVYGDFPCEDDPRAFARYLRDKDFSVRDISIWVKLRYGKGCPSVIQRWLNEKSYQAHLAAKRKS